MKHYIKGQLVLSVYSGRDGKCCCGCSGNHYYSKATRKAASKDRGYKVYDDEINEAQMTRIVGIVKAAGADDVMDCGGNVAVVQGKRVYVAYLQEAK